MRIIIILAILVVLATAGFFIAKRSNSDVTFEQNEETVSSPQSTIKLTSSVFGLNKNIPGKYTCEGENVNPSLTITGVPEGTKGLVLIVDDPDAPSGDWVHWTVWNIKPTVQEIAENSVPAGALEGMTSFGQPGWDGPCPPSGTHHYQFKLYALDLEILEEPDSGSRLDQMADKAEVERAMAGHILDQTVLVGLYQR